MFTLNLKTVVMKKINLFCLALFISIGSIAHSSFYNSHTIITQEDNAVTATITKKTTEEQLNELISYFKENNITLNLSEVNYNEANEIISIKISLEKDGQSSNYGLSSTQSIPDIELGYKNKSLFIKSTNGLETSSDAINNLMDE